MKGYYRTMRGRFLSLLLAAVMAGMVLPWNLLESRAVTQIKNPRIVEDSSMEAGQKVTWDCVWFGSYPQAEVITTVMSENYTAIDNKLRTDGDVVISDSLYSRLESASEWNENGDITLDGVKYRRMKKEDATYSSSSVVYYNFYYNWTNSTTYHYFKYEPIKWRILKVDEKQMFLLSDIVLDDQMYHDERRNITWETSTIRNWLNGAFLNNVFTDNEQSAIADTSVVNADNKKWGTEGGNDTTDKVFILSEGEVYGDAAMSYGFDPLYNIGDEARQCRSSTYAKAMGVGTGWYNGNCSWWLRSPGNREDRVAEVDGGGYVPDDHHCYVETRIYGVRAALNLNLSSDQYSYAGTVCSDGTKNEEDGESPDTPITESNNDYIINRVKAYTSDKVMNQWMALSNEASTLSGDEYLQKLNELFCNYGMLDYKEGIEFIRDSVDERKAYVALTTNDLYLACNFTTWLHGNTPKAIAARSSLYSSALLLNGEFLDYIKPSTYLQNTTPEVKKYKAMFYELMKAESEVKETKESLKLAQKWIYLLKDKKEISDVQFNAYMSKLCEGKSVDIINKNVKEIWNKIANDTKVDMELPKNSALGKFMGYTDKALTVTGMALEDLETLNKVSSTAAVYQEYQEFFDDIAYGDNALPSCMKAAAAQVKAECEDTVKSIVTDVATQITDYVKDTAQGQYLSATGLGVLSSALSTISFSSWIVDKLTGVNVVITKEACVEGYALLSDYYAAKLIKDKSSFQKDMTESNAWKFYEDYNMLYQLRIAGESAYLSMCDPRSGFLKHIFVDNGGYAAKKEYVDNTIFYLQTDCQIQLSDRVKDEGTLYQQKIISACPIDMEIYDKNNTLVCQIPDGKPLDVRNEYGRFVSVYRAATDDYVKIAYLNNPDEFNIKLTGTNTGVVNVVYTLSNGNTNSNSYSLLNQPIQTGSIFTLKISADLQSKPEIIADLTGEREEQITIQMPEAKENEEIPGGVYKGIKVTDINLSASSAKVAVNEKVKLMASVLPNNATNKAISWTSSDPQTATVDQSGIVTGISRGTTTIKALATDGLISKECVVTVTPSPKSDKEESNKIGETKIEASRITLSGISKKIAAGKKIKLGAKVSPSNTTNKKVTWTSSNHKVAAVNGAGVVTMKKKSGGKSVTITAMAVDGSGAKATYKIKSMKGVVKKVTVSGKKTVKAGKSLKLKAKVTASKGSNKKLKWSSSNKKYATVSGSGKVKTYKKGKGKTVKITAMATDGSGKKKTVKIKIK